MDSENFISCHVHAYEYFGGVTRLLVPDNLRAGVTRNTRYETVCYYLDTGSITEPALFFIP